MRIRDRICLFFQVENLGGEVFQVDTKDMKKKLMSEWGIFSSQGGESFQVCGRIYAPVNLPVQVNPVLRAVFDLGPPGCDEYSQTRNMSKAQRVSFFFNLSVNLKSFTGGIGL